MNPDLPDNVINQQPSSVIADLMGIMEHIITEGEEEAYQSEIQYRNAQSEFKRFIKSAEGWRKFEFISSILGMLALVALIVISIFRSRIVESIILGSAVMDEYKFVNPSAPPTYVKAYSIPPAYPNQIKFQLPDLPQNWGDKGAEGKQTRCPNDRLDHNNLNHNYTFGNPLHNIQKVSLCILITNGMLPLVPI